MYLPHCVLVRHDTKQIECVKSNATHKMLPKHKFGVNDMSKGGCLLRRKYIVAFYPHMYAISSHRWISELPRQAWLSFIPVALEPISSIFCLGVFSRNPLPSVNIWVPAGHGMRWRKELNLTRPEQSKGCYNFRGYGLFIKMGPDGGAAVTRSLNDRADRQMMIRNYFKSKWWQTKTLVAFTHRLMYFWQIAVIAWALPS